MKLHENKELFSDAIQAASRPKENGGLGIKNIFIEKDYWICRALSLMSANDSNNHAIFKGGTSLTKAYKIGNRFSEDIDIAISDALELSGNKLKNLIQKTSKSMTHGLNELVIPRITSKGAHYHKAIYNYPQALDIPQAGGVKIGQLLIEINAFANPYPFQKCTIQSFLTEFLLMAGSQDIIEEYDMQPFKVNVLDRRKTLTEKTVSILRFSLSKNYIPQLASKIRHFYDLHYLLQDQETLKYLNSSSFKTDLKILFQQDQERFDEPEGWKNRKLSDSPILYDFDTIWKSLEVTYLRELPDLAYKNIPPAGDIKASIKKLISYL